MAETPGPYPVPRTPTPAGGYSPHSSQRTIITPAPGGGHRRVRCTASTSASELRRIVKAMGVTEEDANDRPRFDAWPACATASLSSPQRAMKSVLLQHMEEHIEGRLAEITRKFKPAPPPTELRFGVFRDALAMFITESKTFAGVLDRILHELDAFMEHSMDLAAKLQTCQQQLLNVDTQYSKIVGNLQLGYRHELQDHKDMLQTQEQDMKQSRLLTDLVTQKNIEWRNELSNAQTKIVDRDRVIQGNYKELEYKRAALKELQQRNNALMDENQYLKGICKHNKDLLEEVSQWRKTVEALTFTNGVNEQKLVLQAQKEKEKCASFMNTIKNLKRAVTIKDSEIRMANEKVSSLQSIAAALRTERDTMVVSWTPRPNLASLQSIPVFQKAGFNAKARTVTAIQQLQTISSTMSESVETNEKKLGVYQSLMYFLDEKDLTRAQDGSIPPPVLSVVSWGMRPAVPHFLRSPQLFIPLRHVSRNEYFFTVRDMWAERMGSLASATAPVPFNEFLEQFFQTFYSGVDSAYNIYFASHTHYQSILDAELFLRVLNGDLPEKFVHEDLALGESIRVGIIAVAAKLNAAADKKKNVVKRRVLWDILQRLLPTKSDSDVLRVKFAIQKETERVLGDQASREDIPWDFVATDDGGDSFLIELLRKQHLQEYELWRFDFEQEILKKKPGGPTINGMEVLECINAVDATKTPADVLKYMQTAGVAPDIVPEDIGTLNVPVDILLTKGHIHYWMRGVRRQLKKGAPPPTGPSTMYAADRVPATDPAHKEATSGMGVDPKRAEELAKRNVAAAKVRLGLIKKV